MMSMVEILRALFERLSKPLAFAAYYGESLSSR
jgi:hypothetical protein